MAEKIYDIYFRILLEYQQKYGEKTTLLMQVGSFYELYALDLPHRKIHNLKEITGILNILLSRKSKKYPHSESNPLMAGFQPANSERHIDILLKNNYTIVVMDQFKIEGSKKFDRKVTRVISPGTTIDCIRTPNYNNLAYVYITLTKNYFEKIEYLSFNIGVTDISIGNVWLYNTKFELNNSRRLYEDVYRFIESYNPKELVFCFDESLTKRGLREKIEGEITSKLTRTRNFHCYNYKDEKIDSMEKVTFQNVYLKRYFKFEEDTTMTAIEQIDLERELDLVKCLILLLEFIKKHDETLLTKINKPKIWYDKEHLILNHNSIYQLDIFSRDEILADTRVKINSLYDILRKTKTILGTRKLRYMMSNPILNKVELNRRYDLIEDFQKRTVKQKETIKKSLILVSDITRKHRKMLCGTIQPYEFMNLTESYQAINNILKVISRKSFKSIYDKLNIDKDNIKQLNEYITEYSKYFELEKLESITLNNIMESFFSSGNFIEIDSIQERIKRCKDFFEIEAKKINEAIISNKKRNSITKVEHNDIEGYYFKTTQKRSKDIEVKYPGKYDIRKCSGKSSQVKIFSKEIYKNSVALTKAEELIKREVRGQFIILMGKFYDKYFTLFEKLIYIISEVDIYLTFAEISKINKYVRPQIVEKEESFFKAKEMRHPIIELLIAQNKFTNYVPVDLELNKNGILLYGVNGTGKSSLMKAVGLNILMAQIGCFVPCTNFEYCPYKKIFTRISGNDNLFLGQSSFDVEMSELKSILELADKNSLVIGDEVCRGTEDISGVAIVTTTLRQLVKKNTSFIFATHLHQVAKLDEVKELEESILIKHLSIKCLDDDIIYSRKLEDGSGTSSYGIEVARFILGNSDFIRDCHKLRRKIVKNGNEIKKSRYNSNMFFDRCTICKKELDKLETHHIIEQQEYRNKTYKGNVPMNSLGNLMALCSKCHKKEHHGELDISGYSDSIKKY
jgi:DNA mismatch repair protein MutS